MKFYISARWNLKETVSQMQDYLISKGHEITLDWTKRPVNRRFDADKERSKNYSEEEIKSILEADIFIHISDFEGKGKYSDIGIAIAGTYLCSKPKAYVIGNPANESQHYFNHNVNRIITNDYYEGLEKILEENQ